MTIQDVLLYDRYVRSVREREAIRRHEKFMRQLVRTFYTFCVLTVIGLMVMAIVR